MVETATPEPAPIPIKNSFSGLMMVFPNPGIHSLIAATFTFRKQLTIRTEAQQQSGWSDALNIYMMQNLNRLRTHTNRITYNSANISMGKIGNDAPDPKNVNLSPGSTGGKNKSQEQLLTDATDVNATLQKTFDDGAPTADNLLGAPQGNRQVLANLDGTDLNMPQMDSTNCPNDHMRAFVEGLDNFVVQASRLDSRNDSSGTIAKFESAMLQGLLSQLWTICQVFGGEARRIDIPGGTLPNDEVNTFMPNTFQQGSVAKVTGA